MIFPIQFISKWKSEAFSTKILNFIHEKFTKGVITCTQLSPSTIVVGFNLLTISQWDS